MTGSYIIEDVNTTLGATLSTTTFKKSKVSISVGYSPEIRNFTVELFPGVFPGVQLFRNFNLDLSNGEIRMTNLDTGLSCGASNIVFDEANQGNNTTYTVSNGDLLFNIAFTENLLSVCSTPASQSTFTLLKVPDDQTFVPDDNFEQALINLGYDSVLDDFVTTNNINTVTSINLSNQNIIESTGIESFTSLNVLDFSDNFLDRLDVTALGNLLDLNLSDNVGVFEIKVPSSTEVLTMNNTRLNVLNIEVFSNLKEFYCNNCSGIYSQVLPISLEVLEITGSDQLSFNLSVNTNLISLILDNNNLLEYVNLSNNNNSNITNFSATGNTSLSCMLVDNVAYMLSSFPNALDTGQTFVSSCSSVTNTYVPDDNFEQALINLGYDTVLDNFVPTVNLNAITSLDILDLGINDMTGIESMTQLTELHAGRNNFTSIDLSANVNLTRLNLLENDLSQIDLSNNLLLESITLSGARITNLDVSIFTHLKSLSISNTVNLLNIDLSQNQFLESFIAVNSNLHSIDLSNNIALEFINISPSSVNNSLNNLDLLVNQNLKRIIVIGIPMNNIFLANKSDLERLTLINTNLTTIDLSTNLDLTYINLSVNQLSTIDVSNLLLLEDLSLVNNNLSSLYLGNNTLLKRINITNNNLVSLNLDNNSMLTNIYVGDNQLTSLSIVNGNNQLLLPFNPTTDSNFSALDNNLTCIQVSDSNYMTTNFSSAIDPMASFSSNCTNSIDDDLSTAGITVYPNPLVDTINLVSDTIIDDLIIYDLSGKIVKEFNVGKKQFSTHLNHLKSGIYILEFSTSGRRIIRQIIKK